MPKERPTDSKLKSQAPNHKLFRILSFGFWICLLFVICNFGFPLPAHAATDPLATSSAVTATVPVATTPPSSSNQAPTAPILLRPSAGSLTADNTPELVWRASSDHDGNTIFYDLYLDGVATYLGISNTSNSASAVYTSSVDGIEIRLIPTHPLTDGTHNWLVKAYDLAGDSTNSATWGLTIDTTPPEFVLTTIDIYRDLYLSSAEPSTVPEGTSFEVAGPKDIYFTITTEPSTTIQLIFTSEDGSTPIYTSLSSANLTTIYPYHWLALGTYSVQVIAIDQANLTTILPTFQLIVSQPVLDLGSILPPLPLPPNIYDLPSTLAYLPATIARVSSRVNLAVIVIASLAIPTFLLLIFLKRRYNLVLINSQGTPITGVTIYHSHPNSPKIYSLHDTRYHKLYIPYLAKYSTLTIKTNDSLTIISLAKFKSPLTLIV